MKFAKSMTAAAAVVLAVGLAGPAFADSGSGSSGGSGSGSGSSGQSDTDQMFMQALNKKGIHMTARDALSLAHATCSTLRQGSSFSGALVHVKNNSKLSSNDAVVFGDYAVYAYCREYMPKKGQ